MAAAVACASTARPGLLGTIEIAPDDVANLASAGARFTRLRNRANQASACFPPIESLVEEPLGSSISSASRQRGSFHRVSP